MFEKEIKFIVDFNLNKIRKSGSFLTIDKLLSAGMHPAIVKYISTELDTMIYEDRKKLLNNSMFDYSGTEINRHFNLISREIKRNKRLSFDDVKKLMIQGVSFNVNYLIRPKWSLSRLIFDPAPSRSAEEIRILLDYPYYYEYLRIIINGYLEKKKADSLTVVEFEQLFTKIDQEIFSSNPSKILENVLASMCDFFNEGAAVKDKLPPELLLMFLKEKNLNYYSNKLRKAIPGDGKQKYNLNELRSILFHPGEVSITLPKEEEVNPPEPESVEEDIIEEISSEEKSEQVKNAEFVKVTSQITTTDKEYEIDIEEEFSDSEDLLNRSEEEIAEEINLPLVEDHLQDVEERNEEEQFAREEGTEEEKETSEIGLEGESDIILPDEQVQDNMNKEEPVKSGSEVENDEEEIKFELEEKSEPDAVYEFEEEKENDEKETNSFEDFNEQDFNLSELEQELKQIEEEFNLQNEPVNTSKPPEPKQPLNNDIFRFLTDKETARIVSNIFNEDRDDFTNTLERISECDSYEKSTEILKGVFLTYRINPYSRDAVTMTNAVSRYFDKK